MLVEGETDVLYYRTAAELLQERDLDEFEIEWVGRKDPKSGQGINAGSKGLDATLNVLRAKPNLLARQVILVYDSDTNKPTLDEGSLHVRSVPGEFSQ